MAQQLPQDDICRCVIVPPDATVWPLLRSALAILLPEPVCGMLFVWCTPREYAEIFARIAPLAPRVRYVGVFARVLTVNTATLGLATSSGNEAAGDSGMLDLLAWQVGVESAPNEPGHASPAWAAFPHTLWVDGVGSYEWGHDMIRHAALASRRSPACSSDDQPSLPREIVANITLADGACPRVACLLGTHVLLARKAGLHTGVVVLVSSERRADNLGNSLSETAETRAWMLLSLEQLGLGLSSGTIQPPLSASEDMLAELVVFARNGAERATLGVALASASP